MRETQTLAAARAEFFRANAMPAQGGYDAPRWTFTLGPLRVRLRNFSWRRRAIAWHDTHHILTGYPCTPSGEMRMAAWEFGAGRYPHPYATLFCLPLVGMGALGMPRKMLRAFVRGRRGRSLYGTPLSPTLIATEVRILQRHFAPFPMSPATWREVAAFARLASLSVALMAAPLFMLAAALYVLSR